LSAIESIRLCALAKVLAATSLSPASMALRTFLIIVRSSDLNDALCAFRFSVCLARFFADAMFGMFFSPKLQLMYKHEIITLSITLGNIT